MARSENIMKSSLLEEGSGAPTTASACDCKERVLELQRKLDVVAYDPPLETVKPASILETHREFLLKEMAWMAADFDVERKRHVTLRKRRSKAITQHFRGLRGRLRRQAHEYEVARKKSAARVSRLIKNFWVKIDRLVAYKRRLEWHRSQRKVMDRHLAHLVRQTEQYTEDLADRLNMGIVIQKAGTNVGINADIVKSYDYQEPQMTALEKRSSTSFDVPECSSLAERLEAADRRARETRILRPFILDSTVRLRPYQQEGLDWLVSMHERRLNGILADEMGLGKTLQAISLLAHLASHKGLWGPHLIVVPTSCLLNWESELKKFCPSLKVITYYGSAKARKHLRAGWSRASAVHVIVTSYQLAVQDASIFRRKKFYYLILDEAHNIKNFESRRWRTLLAFQAQRRLLLTGTPLQNSLMELWSLMHFLMPQLFRSQHEFSYWFANPLQSAVEGKSKISDDLVKRLHAVMRPFVLRRLKRDVAKQLPGKFEHLVRCQLSRRQLLLYEEFITRSSGRHALNGKRSEDDICVTVMNIVMQLRKVCNHPDLFEPRSVVAPLVLPPLVLAVPYMIVKVIDSPVSLPSDRLFRSLDGEADSLRRLLVQAPLASRNAPVIFDDKSLSGTVRKANTSLFVGTNTCSHAQTKGAAKFVLHTLKLRSAMNEITSPASLKYTCDFIFAVFGSSRPLAKAWRAISTSSKNGLVFSAYRLKANRERLVASDALREQLESSSAFLARYEALFETIKRVSFVVPATLSNVPVFIGVPSQQDSYVQDWCLRLEETNTEDNLACCSQIREALSPMSYVALALRVSFPDRSLVQWDSGKFHELAPLLRRLKQGSHRCLVFTQMSKMLDVLELFLCWHGHSYSRLDGGTPPNDRQRLMDRFNSDPSIFCFVLSTRSGGLGVNLIGADAVIFYDSDWNPAMDAQAMDRAHRIGQTRDVHIYRLICIATIEENILLKARQKQKLEFVTITEGNFNSGKLQVQTAVGDASKLHELLIRQETSGDESAIAAAMVQLEDSEDVQNARAAAAEAATDAQEFDDNDCTNVEPDPDESSLCVATDNEGKVGMENDEALEAEFAAWQQQIGPDPDALALSLNAVERSAFEQRDKQIFVLSPGDTSGNTDFLTLSERRLIELIKKETSVENSAMDVDAIESLKKTDERRACFEGELLATDLYFEAEIRNAKIDEQEFLKHRRFAKSAKRERECTGSAWEVRVDAVTSSPFWYNVDTAEATWLKPLVIQRRDSYIKASRGGFANWPKEISLRVFTMCEPTPTRLACTRVCRSWARACSEDHLFVKILPTERLGQTELNRSSSQKTVEAQARRSQSLASVRSAIDAAQPGQTLIVGPGHYWEDVADMPISVEIRIVGDTLMPERVIIELSSALRWCADGGSLVGMTLRQAGVGSKAFSVLTVREGHLTCHRIVVDNAGRGGAAVVVHDGAYVHFDHSTVANAAASGIFLHPGARATLAQCNINGNNHCGLSIAPRAICFLKDCLLERNGWTHILALTGSIVALKRTQLGADTTETALVKDHKARVAASRTA